MKKHILGGHNDRDIQEILRNRLELFGYSVDTAGDGREALLQLDRTNFNGLLLDIRLPYVNGLEVLRQVRKRYPSTPVVMMTGSPDKEIVAQAISEGAQAVLALTFEKEQLKQVADHYFGPA